MTGPDQQDPIMIGVSHLEAGRLDEAAQVFRGILQDDPNHPDALHLLGLAAFQAGAAGEALEWINKAVIAQPGNPVFHSSIGLVFKALGDLEQAETALARAVEIDPEFAAARFNLGVVLGLAGWSGEAITHFQAALSLMPDDAETHFNLGLALERQGLRDEARAACRAATHLDPVNGVYWDGFARCLTPGAAVEPDAELAADLGTYLLTDDADATPLRHLVCAVLRQQPDIARLVALVENDENTLAAALEAEGGLAPFGDPLLLAFLKKEPVVDAMLEHLLVAVRRTGLLQATGGSGRDSDLAIWIALAHQCFVNEYVFFETAAETEQVDALARRIDAGLDDGAVVDPASVVILSAYRPLWQTSAADGLARHGDLNADNRLASLLRRQLHEPLAERDISENLPTVTPVTDDVSQAVRAQYEENPFPRWLSVRLETPRPVSAVFEGLFPHLRGWAIDWPQSPQILVAGSGTGRHPIATARRFQGATVLSCDLSRASLAYASRQAAEQGVDNLRLVQGDILELGVLEQQFDIVESSGVLHHMRDPLAGWRVLVGLLKPGGLMNIGLYSEISHRRVVEVVSFIETGGYDSSPDGIRRCRHDIMGLPVDHPVHPIVREDEFYTASNFRDLFQHVQVHRFTLPDLAVILDDLGLEFLGFELPNNTILHAYRDRFPEDPAGVSLTSWHEFEVDHPNVFNGMYQFWALKR
jgi:tetratricopeptide (TPR) repeat protein/SAM-dependent methyltransferase